MRQHFVPQTYLKQWYASDGRLVRYIRTGPPGAPTLRWERKGTDGICWETNLYTLPEGGIANGLTGDGVEHLLAKQVDQSISSAITRIEGHFGQLEGETSELAKWLMQTFVARSPSCLADLESGSAAFTAEHEQMIRQTLVRAQGAPAIAAELAQYLDPRMPAVAARAGLAAIAASEGAPQAGWYEGAVHILHLRNEKVRDLLDGLGLGELPTFEEPVVQWDANDSGLVASFSLSPRSLAFVVQGDKFDPIEVARRHACVSLRHRQSAICRTKAKAGLWLEMARHLQPWQARK